MYQEKKEENKSKIKQNKNRGKCRMEKKITTVNRNLFEFQFQIIANTDYNFTP